MNLIKAEVIKDSYNPDFDSRITTMVIEYPRIILSELNTHRVLSKNSSSSRAVPVKKMLELIASNPAMPVRFGDNQPGMQDKGENSKNSEAAKVLWIEAAKSSASYVKVMHDMNIHKQVCNRLIEPFQMMKTCITATQWSNFFNLRLHTDADPTIYALAEAMKSAMNSSNPVELKEGEWYVPFVNEVRVEGNQVFYDQDGFQISVEDALMISCSCSAQTSYRLNDYSLEKAKIIYDKLINSKPAHSSPTEHCAMPITRKTSNPLDYFGVKGVTHIDRNLVPCSGNFHGWVQYRQLIPDNAVMY
jgi:thymidylate synthase ThyX